MTDAADSPIKNPSSSPENAIDASVPLSTRPSSSFNFRLLAPLALVTFIDSMSYMIVASSIVFYIFSLGGTKEFYGVVLSMYSFSSFCFKPMLGYWCDTNGHKFRMPYLMSIAVSTLGSFLYFIASGFDQQSHTLALAMVLLGRFLCGAGAANQALAFSYLAEMFPIGELTKSNSLLRMTRVFGFVMAPGFNIFLANVQMTIPLGDGSSFELTPLNSVGLLMVLANALSFLAIYCLLQDVQNPTKINEKVDAADERSADFWYGFLNMQVLLPLFCVFMLNANFQLMVTGMAPAASTLLGWGPVQVSGIFGFNAILMFFFTVLTFQLSARGVRDEVLLLIGVSAAMVGYTVMYFFWSVGTTIFLFVLPVVFASPAFPFLGGPIRSLFTRAILRHPSLRAHQGTMQAVMSMSTSVAGFLAPGLIASFVLRSPTVVESSQDQRQFTQYALFAPLLSLAVLLPSIYVYFVSSTAVTATQPTRISMGSEVDMEEDEGMGSVRMSVDERTINEATQLLAANNIFPSREFHPKQKHTEGIRQH